jgi:DNA-binding winged helix-turn-helix (wHTH) protein
MLLSGLVASMGALYSFGEFSLDTDTRLLCRAGALVSLTPKAFDVLLFLAQNPNRVLAKEELLQAVWGDVVVEEGNLTQYISHLRKALGDGPGDSRLIVTIARKGYQFTPRVFSRAPDLVQPAARRGAACAISTTDTQFVEAPTNGETAKAQRISFYFEITYHGNVISNCKKE